MHTVETMHDGGRYSGGSQPGATVYARLLQFPCNDAEQLSSLHIGARLKEVTQLHKRQGDVRFGSLADNAAGPHHVRFTPESGHRGCAYECPLCAKSGLMHCNN
jgi:hypothetical protein